MKSYDYFRIQKEQSFTASASSIIELATFITDSSSLDIQTFVHFALWGNQSDLSLFIHAADSDMTQFQASSDFELKSRNGHIIINDTQALMSHIHTLKKSGKIIIVLDNAGFELYCDLCLAHALTIATDCTIIFEAKDRPWFVSDTTPHDFNWILEACKDLHTDVLYSLVSQWQAFLADGKWILKTNSFWTSPHSFWNMETQCPELYSSLSSADLVVFKGDLNYRKMVHDASWGDVEFRDAIGDMANIGPFVMLRTCKSDTIAGLGMYRQMELGKIDGEWMVNGKYGLIQFHDCRS